MSLYWNVDLSGVGLSECRFIGMLVYWNVGLSNVGLSNVGLSGVGLSGVGLSHFHCNKCLHNNSSLFE